MFSFFLFLHLLGAVGMGFYLLLPFAVSPIARMEPAAAASFIGGWAVSNRVAQVLLVIQLLTGGYLMSQGDYSHTWQAAVIVLFLAVGAFSGLLGAKMKKVKAAAAGAESAAAKVRTFSIVNALCYLIILVLMTFPSLI